MIEKITLIAIAAASEDEIVIAVKKEQTQSLQRERYKSGLSSHIYTLTASIQFILALCSTYLYYSYGDHTQNRSLNLVGLIRGDLIWGKRTSIIY